MPNPTFPQFFPLPCIERSLTPEPNFFILCVLSGVFPRVVRPSAYWGMAGWKEILRSQNKNDGMGRKSGRNGAPAPKSRVSLSDSMPGAKVCLLDCARSLLLVLSGFAVPFSVSVCSRAFCARSVRVRQMCLRTMCGGLAKRIFS